MTTEKKTIDFIYEYLKIAVDININWLEFLNKYMDINISRLSYLELEPKLEKLRKELYQIYQNGIIDTKVDNTTIKIRNEIKNVIKEKEYSEIADYIDYVLKASKVDELNVALFVRKSLEICSNNIEKLITLLSNCESKKELLLKDLLEKINNSNLLACYNEESLPVIEYYRSLRIGYKKSGLVSYIYYNFLLMSKIIKIFNELLNDTYSIEDDIAILIQELDFYEKVNNVSCLIDVFNMFNMFTNKLIAKYENNIESHNTLQLSVKSNN